MLKIVCYLAVLHISKPLPQSSKEDVVEEHTNDSHPHHSCLGDCCCDYTHYSLFYWSVASG